MRMLDGSMNECFLQQLVVSSVLGLIHEKQNCSSTGRRKRCLSVCDFLRSCAAYTFIKSDWRLLAVLYFTACICCWHLLLAVLLYPHSLQTFQALADLLDVLAAHSEDAETDNNNITSNNKNNSWWYAACADAGALLLLLASRSAAPAAAGGVAAAGSGASLGLLLPLMWRLGGVLLPGLWQQQLLQLAWLLLCCSSQQVSWCCFCMHASV